MTSNLASTTSGGSDGDSSLIFDNYSGGSIVDFSDDDSSSYSGSGSSANGGDRLGERKKKIKKCKVKKSSFSKQTIVVLERENKIFLGMKEGNSKLIGGQVEWFFLWKNNILWCKKNKSWRFKLDDGINLFLGN